MGWRLTLQQMPAKSNSSWVTIHFIQFQTTNVGITKSGLITWAYYCKCYEPSSSPMSATYSDIWSPWLLGWGTVRAPWSFEHDISRIGLFVTQLHGQGKEPPTKKSKLLPRRCRNLRKTAAFDGWNCIQNKGCRVESWWVMYIWVKYGKHVGFYMW